MRFLPSGWSRWCGVLHINYWYLFFKGLLGMGLLSGLVILREREGWELEVR